MTIEFFLQNSHNIFCKASLYNSLNLYIFMYKNPEYQISTTFYHGKNHDIDCINIFSAKMVQFFLYLVAQK